MHFYICSTTSPQGRTTQESWKSGIPKCINTYGKDIVSTSCVSMRSSLENCIDRYIETIVTITNLYEDNEEYSHGWTPEKKRWFSITGSLC